jgi:hypothetical protein
MAVTEQQIIEITDEIILGIVKLAIQQDPGILSGKVFKSLPDHSRFEEMKLRVLDYLKEFNGHFEETSDVKKLSELRFDLYQFYSQK